MRNTLFFETEQILTNTYIFQTACGDPKFIPNESFGE